MSSTVHLVSGDGAACALSASGVDGKIVVFREALVSGPVSLLPAEEWFDLRSQFLAEVSDKTATATRDSLTEQEEPLRSVDDDIVLWFGRDVFCQVILAYVLHRANEASLVKLSLVCPAVTGTAKAACIGSLTPNELAAELPNRVPLSAEQIRAGADAFAAYASEDPAALTPHLSLSSVPGMAMALSLHAQRFPSPADGLGRPQRSLLASLASGGKTFPTLFRQFIVDEPGYGFADLQVWNELAMLADGDEAAIGPPVDGDYDIDRLFELTEYGKRLLAGSADFVADNGPTAWLGGVDLASYAPAPRFDPATAQFV